MAKLIDGKAVAKSVRERITHRVADFKRRAGRSPGLHVILAGDDPASAVYVRNKEKAAAEVGMVGVVHRLAAAVTEAELLSRVSALNSDPTVDGILVQFPVPKQISQTNILEVLSPEKDVDGLHVKNVGRLWSGKSSFSPCTPLGCMELLQSLSIDLTGKHAVIIGRSNLVGKPMAALLLAADTTVTVAHSRSQNLAEICRSADLLIVAVGRAKMVPGSWIQPGAIVIDVGMNRDEHGALCGDVDYATAEPVAGAITPVPGGVGPMTIAMLLQNTLQAAEWRENRTAPMG